MASIRIKKGDTVKIISGRHKGKIGTVLGTSASAQTVTIDKIGLMKRHVKPSQINPRGGTKEVHKPLPLSSVALVVDTTKGTTSRVSFGLTKNGSKVRIAKKTKKEIK